MSETANTISRIPFDLPAADKAEMARLAKARYDRPVNFILRQMVREWIAQEQAEEAMAERVAAREAARGEAA